MSDSDSADNVAGGSSKKARQHHNNLERKRRDLIKDSFTFLKDTVPSLRGDKPVSRAQILRKASEYIQHMKSKNERYQNDIDNLNRQNAILGHEIKQLGKIKATGNYILQHRNLPLVVSESDNIDESAEELEKPTTELKKKKLHD